MRRAESFCHQEGKDFVRCRATACPAKRSDGLKSSARSVVAATMMTTAPMMTAAVAMTEMFTIMAALTDQKPAGIAVVR